MKNLYQKAMHLLKTNLDFCLLALFLLSVPVFGILNRPIGTVRDLHCYIDTIIPVVPPFILIYHSWFPFILFNLYRLYMKDRQNYRNFASHLFIGQWAAYITFIFFQTDVTRAIDLGNSIFDKLVALTYMIDNHYAGFPSVHALTTAALIINVLVSKQSWAYKVFASLYGVLIMASILLVKQHVFWDLPGGIVYAAFLYPLAKLFVKEMEKRYASLGKLKRSDSYTR